MKKLVIAIFLLFIAGNGVAGEVTKKYKDLYTISDIMGLQYYYGSFYYDNKKTVIVTPGITLSVQGLYFKNYALGFEAGFNYHNSILTTDALESLTWSPVFNRYMVAESKNFHIGPSVDCYFNFQGFKLVAGLFVGYDSEINSFRESSMFATGGASDTKFFKHSFSLKAKGGISIPLEKSFAIIFYYRIGILYSRVGVSSEGNASDETMVYAAELDKESGVTMVNSISFGIQYYR